MKQPKKPRAKAKPKTRPKAGRASAEPVSTTTDWVAIRHRYVTGAESLRQMSAALKIAWTTIRYHSEREGWGGERAAFRSQRFKKAVEQSHKYKIQSEAEIDGQAHELAIAIIAKAGEMIANIFTPNGLSAAAVALEKAHERARLTAGLAPTRPPAPEVPVGEGPIIIRRRRADGTTYDDRIEPKPPAAVDDSGPPGLPAEPEPAAVP